MDGICPKGSYLFKKKAARNLAAHWHLQAWHGLRASALLRIRRCVLLPARALAALPVLGTNLGLPFVSWKAAFPKIETNQAVSLCCW